MEEVHEPIKKQVRWLSENQGWDQIWNLVSPQVWDQVRDQTWDPTFTQILDQVWMPIIGLVENNL